MADYGQGSMVSRNFCQAYLQEVGLTQILGDHDFLNIFFSETYFRRDFMAYFKANSKIDSRTYSWTNKFSQIGRV